ncbi:MAG: hypothetical protein K2H89_04360 [Oscillospiraceae bacterium]|nr:hypothetical protein [Oscillospiraceae bacterium]
MSKSSKSDYSFKDIFYDSQARLADTVDALKRIIFKIEEDMRIAEELVIADESENDN